MSGPHLKLVKEEPPQEKVNLAIIGTGYWGPNMVRSFLEDSRVNLKLICDKDEERLNFVSRHFRGLEVTSDSSQVINNPEIDAVVICTPTTSHYTLAKSCLKKGKHVLVEKPMATTSEECRDLIAIAEKNRLKLMVGHIFLYNPGVKYIADLIESGELGDIVYLYGARTNLGPIRTDVNVLWDLAPHDISIFNFWMKSEPVAVNAIGKTYLSTKCHDVVFASLKYPGDVVGNLHLSWLDPRKTRQIVIVGSKQMVTFNDLDPVGSVYIYDKRVDKVTRNNERVVDGVQDYKMIIQEGKLTVPKIQASEPLRLECRAFIDWLIDDKKPASPGENGLAVVRVLEAAYRVLQSEQGWAPVDEIPNLSKKLGAAS